MKTIKNRSFAFLLVTALTTALANCSFRYSKEGADGIDPSGAHRAQSVGFSDVANAVFTKSCNECHSREGGPSFDRFDLAKAQAGSIRQSVFVDRDMPRGSPLTSSQLQILKSWLDEGAPEVAPVGPVPSPTPTASGDAPDTVTWDDVKSKVVDVSCAGCHFAGNPHGRSDLTDESIFKSEIESIMAATLVELDMPPAPRTLSATQKLLIANFAIDSAPINSNPTPGPSPVPSASGVPQPHPSSFPPSKPVTFTVSAASNPAMRFDIGYTVGVHHGEVNAVSGTVSAQLSPIVIQSGHIEVPLDKMTTDNPQRDCHMRSAMGVNYVGSHYPGAQICGDDNQLPATGPDSVVYPTIDLDLEKFSAPAALGPGGAIDLTIPVKLTFHGVAKDMKVPVHLAEDTSGALTITGSFPVSTKDHGVTVKKILFIGVDDVATVHLDLSLKAQ